MKVLIDLTSLADNFSGIERYAASLAFEMIKDEETQFILVFKAAVHEIFKENVNKNNVEVVVLNSCSKLAFNQIRLPNAIRRIKADYYLFLAFPVPIFLFKKNMISTIHDICCWDCPETMKGMSKWYFRVSHKVALLKCTRIITISEFSRQRIVKRLCYPQNKIWLIQCGIDSKFLNFHKQKDKTKCISNKYKLPDSYILSLSTLEPRKNLNLLIRAYSELLKEGKIHLPLVLAGRVGWKMEELITSIDEFTRKHIFFTGFVDDEDLPYLYGNAKLFVFPSKYEGFGIPPLEAAACGTLVLSSDSTSLPEVLGDNATFFRNNDCENLKYRIIDCICNCNKTEFINKYQWKAEAFSLLQKMKECYEN